MKYLIASGALGLKSWVGEFAVSKMPGKAGGLGSAGTVQMTVSWWDSQPRAGEAG